ncbi:hypothetical protein CIK05_05665 [Bdellovibrio sp. qaytius]|nr:hypothetical protein CIK05_05665 [Bdellovibrio sp. qaytius]
MMNPKSLFITVALTMSSLSAFAIPQKEQIGIWPTIPFIRGADLCAYKDAYSTTRTGYMDKMVGIAKDLMQAGAKGKEVLPMLVGFNNLYDQNIATANQYKYMEVTLESSLKAFVSDYYRNIRPRVQRMSFTRVNDVLNVVRAAANGQRDGYLDQNLVDKLDYVGYGTYSLAPNCQGDIQVTLHLMGRDGEELSYIGNGQPAVVMSQIASRMFEDFQRTKFPTKLKVGNKTLTLLGAMNGSVETTFSVKNASRACETLGGRLPTGTELEIIDSYGDWNGGVSINDAIWALTNGNVYAPHLRNPSPVRSESEVNAHDEGYRYYCVQD